MNRPSRLVTTPQELYDSILEFLPAKDLSTLRLVSREVGSRTYSTFTRVCFTNRKILLSSPGSVHTAIRIAQHSDFGSALRKLVFFIDELGEPKIEDAYTSGISFNEWDKHYRHGKDLLNSPQSYCADDHVLAENINSLSLRQRKDHFLVQRILYHQQESFRLERNDISALIQLFTQLGQYGKEVKIIIADFRRWNALADFGELDALKGFKLNWCLSQEGSRSPLRALTIFEAISRSPVGCVASVSMNTTFNVSLHKTSYEDAVICSNAFKRIKSLHIKVDFMTAEEIAANRNDGRLWDPEGARNFAMGLAESTTLETLILETLFMGDRDDIVEAVLAQTFKNLRKMVIREANCLHLDQVVEFVKRQPRLEVFEIGGCNDFRGWSRGVAIRGEDPSSALLRLSDVKIVVSEYAKKELDKLW